jgi:hypothetical protein
MTDQKKYERFVSLHGFFAFEYPSQWTNEVDASGHYIFYQGSGGSGVLRVMLLENEFTGEDAAKKMLEAVYEQNKSFEPSLYAAGKNRFVHFVKRHEVNGADYTVYYWVTASASQVVLFTFTVQSAMKNMPTAEEEKNQIESMIGTFTLLDGHPDKASVNV